jgi:hypothetical protein
MKNVRILVLCMMAQVFVARAFAVTIYEHNNYHGRSMLLQPGFHEASELGIGDNQASSVKVPAGYKVTVYDNKGFSGNSVVYTKDCAAMGKFNDKTTSVLVERLPDDKTQAVIYGERDYGGVSQALTAGKYNNEDLLKLLGHNCLKSLRVTEGFEVILYELKDFSGKQYIAKEDTKNVADKVACIEVRRRQDESKVALHDKVALYDETEFHGTVKEIGEDCVMKAADLGLKQISSIFVPKGFTVIIRPDDEIRGSFDFAVRAKGSSRKLSDIGQFALTSKALIVVAKERSEEEG